MESAFSHRFDTNYVPSDEEIEYIRKDLVSRAEELARIDERIRSHLPSPPFPSRYCARDIRCVPSDQPERRDECTGSAATFVPDLQRMEDDCALHAEIVGVPTRSFRFRHGQSIKDAGCPPVAAALSGLSYFTLLQLC